MGICITQRVFRITFPETASDMEKSQTLDELWKALDVSEDYDHDDEGDTTLLYVSALDNDDNPQTEAEQTAIIGKIFSTRFPS